jgi:peptidoglycan/LPS O-acetylase OafA/YrhL
VRPEGASASPGYRPDIDGLRAIAVLLVVGFHAFPKVVPGGFIGVDVFFVISGFLISNLIAQDMAAGRFSLLRFYGRRARRIFPALFVVLIACLAAGFFLLLPADYRALGADAAWSAAFVANIALFFQAGYFDAASETKPLLHLWSLGIEEQFYIVWPMLLLLLTTRRRWMWQGALVILVVSFAWNVVLTASDPTAAFYLPMARVWELAAGALLALLPLRARSSATQHDAAAWAGLALLAAAVVLIGRDSAFPGWWAVLPVTATALLIFAGPTARVNEWLSHPSLVVIGLISYPLYLWHWPMLVFARIARFGAEPTILMKLALIGASFALAYLTYRWIERPFRFGKSSPLKPIGASAGLAVAACIGLVIVSQAGMPSRFDSGIQNLVKDFQTEANRAYRTGACFLSDAQGPSAFAPDCVSTAPDGSRLVLLWGDSYAAHLFPGLADLQERMKYDLAEYTSSGCPPILGFTSTQRRNCDAINAFVMGRIEALKPHTVILGGRWNLYNGHGGWGTMERAAIQATVARLKASGVARIVVVGQFPAWALAPSRILIRNHQLDMLTRETKGAPQIPEYGTDYLDQTAFATEDGVRKHWSAPGVTFISPRATLCNEAGCRLITPGSPPQPIAWDHGHLTVAGSAYFAGVNAEQLFGP